VKIPSLFYNSNHIFNSRTLFINKTTQFKTFSISKMVEEYKLKVSGKPESLEYRGFIYKGGIPVSPFHDIPLWVDKTRNIVNMVVEIPKGQQAKLEINKSEPLNPIKQDIKNGKLRYVAYKYPFNYGAFPQTWENPSFLHPDTKAKGDNDPIDAIDISGSIKNTGEVIRVKILGTYAMIDEGETDWKIVCIDITDPLSDKLNGVEDIEKLLPGKLNEIFTFLRDYKIPDGKPPNQFAFNGDLKNNSFTIQVVNEAHEEWHKLVTGKIESKSISILNTTVMDSPAKVSVEEASKYLKE
jgi:inorganic pyrophosphatase